MLIDNGRLCDHIKIDQCYDADGAFDGTTVMLDMKGYDGCLFIVGGTTVTPADGANLLTGVKVVSNTTAAGAGTDHDICEAITTETGTTTTLTAADFGTTAGVTTWTDDNLLYLDVKASQMYAGDRYISLVTTSTGTFPFHAIAIRYNASNCYKDMATTTRLAFQYDGDL